MELLFDFKKGASNQFRLPKAIIKSIAFPEVILIAKSWGPIHDAEKVLNLIDNQLTLNSNNEPENFDDEATVVSFNKKNSPDGSSHTHDNTHDNTHGQNSQAYIENSICLLKKAFAKTQDELKKLNDISLSVDCLGIRKQKNYIEIALMGHGSLILLTPDNKIQTLLIANDYVFSQSIVPTRFFSSQSIQSPLNLGFKDLPGSKIIYIDGPIMLPNLSISTWASLKLEIESINVFDFCYYEIELPH